MEVVRTGCAIAMVLILAWSACVQTSQVRVPASTYQPTATRVK